MAVTAQDHGLILPRLQSFVCDNSVRWIAGRGILGRFTGSVHFLKQNVVLRDRCRRSDGLEGSKRDFTWQVQGIGHL